MFFDVLIMFVTVSREKPLSFQGAENHHLKRAPLLFVDNFTVTSCTLEQFRHENNAAKHENWCLLTGQRTLSIVFNRFNQCKL